MPIRVLHIIGNLKFGGAEICVKRLVENFSGNKVEAFVYPLRSGAAEIDINANVITNSYRSYDPRKFFDILNICKEKKIDIIHAHLEKPVIAALLGTFFNNIPVIIHEHGSIDLPGFNNSCYRQMLRLFHKRASAFIAVSGVMKESLQQKAKIAADKIQVIYNSVDFDLFVPDGNKRKEIRDSLNIADDKIILGFSGRLDKVKGADIAITALAKLNTTSKNYHLLIAGEGLQRKSFEYLASNLGVINEVSFLGFRDDMPAVINAFDVGLIPSRYEAFGISAVEMMRMKVPVICSAAGGLIEIVTDNQNGLVSASNSPQEFAENIEKLFKDSKFRQELVDNAHTFAEKFSIPEQVTSVEYLYDRLFNRLK